MKERNNWRKRRPEIHQKYGGRCGYCGREIDLKEMQVDHMVPKGMNGGNDIENLMPSCQQCNHYKRCNTVEGFRITMRDLHKRVSLIYIHKVAVNFGMATIKPFDGKFYFEKYERKDN